SGGNNPISWKLRRFYSSNEKHLPAISDPEIESAFKDLLAASWNELPDSLVAEAKKAASKATDDSAGQEALKNVFRAAEACEEFSGTLVTLRMALDDLCGLTGENVGPLPGYIEDAVKAAYNRYMTYLESFGPEENYLRKKVCLLNVTCLWYIFTLVLSYGGRKLEICCLILLIVKLVWHVCHRQLAILLVHSIPQDKSIAKCVSDILEVVICELDFALLLQGNFFWSHVIAMKISVIFWHAPDFLFNCMLNHQLKIYTTCYEVVLVCHKQKNAHFNTIQIEGYIFDYMYLPSHHHFLITIKHFSFGAGMLLEEKDQKAYLIFNLDVFNFTATILLAIDICLEYNFFSRKKNIIHQCFQFLAVRKKAFWSGHLDRARAIMLLQIGNFSMILILWLYFWINVWIYNAFSVG
ncbi:hypothetical protein ACJX0J_023421, partial [Zea mays]